VVGIGLHGQQHSAEGHAGLGNVGIFKLVPSQADKALFQDTHVSRGWIVLFGAGSHTQQEHCGCNHCKKIGFHILYIVVIMFARCLSDNSTNKCVGEPYKDGESATTPHCHIKVYKADELQRRLTRKRYC
jgi:hypothetical protein